QIDPVPGGNASPYDYCTGDPVNCTDLDGNWGFSFKKILNVVAKVAEVASYIPGPIGGIAAAVSAVSYAATGNWAKAAEMTITAAASLVGANTAVKAAITTVKATRAATRVGKAASAAKTAYRNTAAAAKRIFSRCNSFTPDTLVLMGDGSHKPISEITIGDQVIASDPATGESASEPVLDVIVGYGDKHLVHIFMTASDSTGGVVATAGHPFWVIGRGWINAADIQAGYQLISKDGIPHTVYSVVDYGELNSQFVYNLNVGNLHTYSVSADGIDVVAHNRTDKCELGGGKGNSPVGTIVESRGVKVWINSNDHAPLHAHVSGHGPKAKIGKNGRPINGSPELSKRQLEVIDAHRSLIRNRMRKYFKWWLKENPKGHN
ncbi:polymorphic toxin-type HINT domain-containing protein, partial [Kitasatospora indigofera]|uniref:polymorphic toxin-type HINT domain-containing protein n=1 Tax=Kitasatospora indigofera TaxID=67307 RepID=UPI0036A5B73C